MSNVLTVEPTTNTVGGYIPCVKSIHDIEEDIISMQTDREINLHRYTVQITMTATLEIAAKDELDATFIAKNLGPKYCGPGADFVDAEVFDSDVEVESVDLDKGK